VRIFSSFNPYLYSGSAKASGMWTVPRVTAARPEALDRSGRIGFSALYAFSSCGVLYATAIRSNIEAKNYRSVSPTQPDRAFGDGFKHRLKIER